MTPLSIKLKSLWNFFIITILFCALPYSLLVAGIGADKSDHGLAYYSSQQMNAADDNAHKQHGHKNVFRQSMYGDERESQKYEAFTAPNPMSNELTDEQILTNYLLHEYSADVRPVIHANQTLSVVTRIYLIKILDLVEKEQVLHMVLRFQLGWKDPRMTWDAAEFGNLTSIILPGDSLWIPDIQTGNSANDRYGLLRNRAFPFKVHNDGEIWWHPTGSIFTRCSLDLFWFPFDYQRCPIVLESAMHSSSAVNLTVRPNKESVILTMYTENSLWDLKEATGTSYYYKSSSAASAKIYTPGNSQKLENNFTRAVFWFKLKRKTSYYKLNVIYPLFMLTTMQLLTFMLPMNSLARVPQATTILLSVVIFQAVIVDELPKTSENISMISVYTMLMIAVSVVAIVESVFVANLLHRNFGPIKMSSTAAFMLRVFLKPTPKKSEDEDEDGQKKKEMLQIKQQKQQEGASRQQRIAINLRNLEAKALESVREESEEGAATSRQRDPFTLSVQSLSSPDASDGGGARLRPARSASPRDSSGGLVFNFPSPRNNSYSRASLTSETAQNVQEHLLKIFKRATGQEAVETVTVDWHRIAFVINATVFLICIIFVIVIPSILLVFVVPSD